MLKPSTAQTLYGKLLRDVAIDEGFPSPHRIRGTVSTLELFARSAPLNGSPLLPLLLGRGEGRGEESLLSLRAHGFIGGIVPLGAVQCVPHRQNFP